MPLEELPEEIEELEKSLQRLETVSDRLAKVEDRAEQLQGDFRRVANIVGSALEQMRDIEGQRQEGNPWEANRRYQKEVLSDHQHAAEQVQWAGDRVTEFAERMAELFEDLK